MHSFYYFGFHRRLGLDFLYGCQMGPSFLTLYSVSKTFPQEMCFCFFSTLKPLFQSLMHSVADQADGTWLYADEGLWKFSAVTLSSRGEGEPRVLRVILCFALRLVEPFLRILLSRGLCPAGAGPGGAGGLSLVPQVPGTSQDRPFLGMEHEHKVQLGNSL